MRDSDRLEEFYAALCEIHKRSFPDWRFGQLCVNFFAWLSGEKNVDLFFPEEDKMIEYFSEYANKTSIWNRNN